MPDHAARVLWELRQAARRLSAARGYSVALVVNLTLGIAALTAVGTVANDVLRVPLPYPDSARLVVIEHELPGMPIQGVAARFGGFQGQVELYAERATQILDVGHYSVQDAAISDPDNPQYVRVANISAGFFRTLGVAPAFGRLQRDDGEATVATTVLGHALWAGRFAGDPAALEGTLPVEGVARQVLGVLPGDVRFPRAGIELWNARLASDLAANPHALVDGMVARLTPGASADSLRDELDELIAELPRHVADDFVARAVHEGNLRARVTPLREWLSGSARSPLGMLGGGAALIYLAALFNAANLTLVRRHARRSERELRRALGATARQLAAHRIAEAALLAAAIAAVASLIVGLLVPLLVAFRPTQLVLLEPVRVGPASVVAILLLTVLAAALIGVFEALTTNRTRPHHTRTVVAAREPRAGAVFNALQVTVTVVLMVMAGLLVRSFNALSHVDPGFDAAGVVTFRLPFPLHELQPLAGGARTATPFYDAIDARIDALPNVIAAGYGTCTPLSSRCTPQGLTLVPESRPIASTDARSLAAILQVGPGYLRALTIPLVRGRLPRRSDHQDPANPIVINAGLAQLLWPAGDELGQRLVSPDLPDIGPFTVVGVVGDAQVGNLRNAPGPVAYLPLVFTGQQYEIWNLSFAVRTTGHSDAVMEAIRAIVRDTRPDIPMAHVETLQATLDAATAPLRWGAWLLSVAAAATLVLGATGVYSAAAYSVGLRRREFGIRLAVGATAAQLGRLIVAQVGAIGAIGLAAGLAGALAVTRLLGAILFGVPPTDAVTFVAVAAVVASALMIAAYLPARRAACTDPLDALRVPD